MRPKQRYAHLVEGKKGFQKEHQLTPKRIKDSQSSNAGIICKQDNAGLTSPSSSSQRLSRDIYDIANIPGSQVLCCQLRPNVGSQTILEEHCVPDNSDILRGNRLVHWETLENVFNMCFNEHKKFSPSCDGWIRAVAGKKRNGD